MNCIYQILTLILLVLANNCFAQKVTNITAEQVGQSIQVSYNLEAELPCSVTLYYSTDNGAKWQGPLKKVGGDVGEKILKGNRKIIWDVLNEVEQLKFDAVVFKVDARLMGLKEVKIGNQIWSAENLDTDRFANGEYIPELKSNESWADAGMKKQAAWCYYKKDDSSLGAVYGKLYNWYAVADPNGLCPTGWHVPSDGEWTTLETYLGGSSVAGGKIKDIGLSHWVSPNTGATNSSGFTGIPGGFRYANGSYDYFGYGGYWWSATQVSTSSAYSSAYGRYLSYRYSSVDRNGSSGGTGFSVRCIKD